MNRFILIFLSFLILPTFGYNLDFFTRFNDCYLEEYIKEALNCNHDLKAIDKRVEQYRYEINSAFSKEFPSLSVSANYLGTHFPNNDFNIFMKKNSFILPFVVNWELDLLLKTKDKINSKKYIYLSEIANRNASHISLLTDVASAYINILLYDFLINNQKEILSNKDKSLDLNKNKFYFGTIDNIKLNSIFEDLNENKIIYDTLIKNRNSALYNFALLIGRSPLETDEIKRGDFYNFEYQETIPEIINSDVIYSRPDVIEIENKLKSAKLDITVAKKDFFPRFNIFGLLSFDSAGGSFFSWQSSFAYLLMGATQDIFKGGEKIANLKIKNEKFKELVEKYQQVDLQAIKEISNALNIIKQDSINEKTSLEQLNIKKKNFILTNKKYNQGVASSIDYLDDKNKYYEAQQLSAASKAARLVDYFTLYKAVGGQL